MTTKDAPLRAILLAAGRGTRFGEDKLAHPMSDGLPIAAHAARNLQAAGLHVTAVVRPHDEHVGRLLEGEGCEVSVCPDAALGMGHSLAHGVRQTADAGGWIVALADMPAIRPATIERVAYALTSGAGIAAPEFDGERGHPVGFAARHYGELIALSGDTGARSIMQRHRADVVLIGCDDPGVVYDIDRKSDLQRPV
ncbi:MAG: nucleotidyltransferase family protein [Rhodospirillaceae bacterium]